MIDVPTVTDVCSAAIRIISPTLLMIFHLTRVARNCERRRDFTARRESCETLCNYLGVPLGTSVTGRRYLQVVRREAKEGRKEPYNNKYRLIEASGVDRIPRCR